MGQLTRDMWDILDEDSSGVMAGREIIRIIFEKGIELCRDNHGQLVFPWARESQTNIIPAEVTRIYGVRPVLLVERIAGLEVTFLLPVQGGNIVDVNVSGLTQIQPIEDRFLYNILTLQYLLSGVCYHCKQLAKTYSSLSQEEAHISAISGLRDTYIHSFTAEPYYEFEALMTAAVRAQNKLGHIIWHGFSSGSAPQSIETVLTRCSSLPAPLEQRLQSWWNQFGSKAKDYRDCIQHYVPTTWGLIPSATVDTMGDGVWSILLRIPDNPEARSADRFRYNSNLDALTQCWKLTNELVQVTHNALEFLRDYRPSA